MAELVAAGIDVGPLLDLGLAPGGQTTRDRNEPSDIARLVERLAQGNVARVVLEAVGSYAQPLVLALVEAGLSVGVVNPRRIKAFREAEGGPRPTGWTPGSSPAWMRPARPSRRRSTRASRAMPHAWRPSASSRRSRASARASLGC